MRISVGRCCYGGQTLYHREHGRKAEKNRRTTTKFTADARRGRENPRQLLPGSMRLNRPLQNQRKRQQRPPENRRPLQSQKQRQRSRRDACLPAGRPALRLPRKPWIIGSGLATDRGSRRLGRLGSGCQCGRACRRGRGAGHRSLLRRRRVCRRIRSGHRLGRRYWRRRR